MRQRLKMTALTLQEEAGARGVLPEGGQSARLSSGGAAGESPHGEPAGWELWRWMQAAQRVGRKAASGVDTSGVDGTLSFRDFHEWAPVCLSPPHVVSRMLLLPAVPDPSASLMMEDEERQQYTSEAEGLRQELAQARQQLAAYASHEKQRAAAAATTHSSWLSVGGAGGGAEGSPDGGGSPSSGRGGAPLAPRAEAGVSVASLPAAMPSEPPVDSGLSRHSGTGSGSPTSKVSTLLSTAAHPADLTIRLLPLFPTATP